MGLLFNLDIPLDYLNKLNKYYYIPENMISELKLGGYVYIVDRLVPIKTIRYCGILSSVDSKIKVMKFVKNDGLEYSRFHIFYRPKKRRIESAITLLAAIDVIND